MTMPLVSIVYLFVLGLSSRGLAQNVSYPAACGLYALSAYEVYNSVGNDTGNLCQSNGNFSAVLNSLSSCVDAKPTGSSVDIGSLETPILLCKSKSLQIPPMEWAFTATVCCASDEGAKLINGCPADSDPALISSCSVLATDTAWASWSGGAGGGGPPWAIGASSTPSATSIAQNGTSDGRPVSTSNIGLIVGASVGVTLGVILLCATAAFFVYRRRRHQKEKQDPSHASHDSEAYGLVRELGPTDEKAQLHSQDRQEIASTPVPSYAQTAHGRGELDGDSLAKMRVHHGQWELPANEAIGSEVDSEATELRSGHATGDNLAKSTTTSEGTAESTAVSSEK